MIDSDGYRPNVGIVLVNDTAQVFWARRIGQDAWQFPQGGIRTDETPIQAMYRELTEEVELEEHHVEVLGATRGWLRYRLPKRLIRRNSKPVCIGQKQVWFLLRLMSDESEVDFGRTDHPEFDHWRWVDYWHPVNEVVHFKRDVYNRALQELGPLLGVELGSSSIASSNNR